MRKILIFVVLFLSQGLIIASDNSDKPTTESKAVSSIVGVWGIDKEAMKKFSDELLKKAEIEANQIGTESIRNQLIRLRQIHMDNPPYFARWAFHFNADGSGGVLSNSAEIGRFANRKPMIHNLFFWRLQDNKVVLEMYDESGYSKPRQTELSLQGKLLILDNSTPYKATKTDEMYLKSKYSLSKIYFKKLPLVTPGTIKANYFDTTNIQLSVPDGFVSFKENEYYNPSDKEEKIQFYFWASKALAMYVFNDHDIMKKLKTTDEEFVTALRQICLEPIKKANPDANISTGVETLDGANAFWMSGLLNITNQPAKEPSHVKQYYLIDDFSTALIINLTSPDQKGLEKLEKAVKQSKLYTTITRSAGMKELLEAKRKTKEKMKTKNEN